MPLRAIFAASFPKWVIGRIFYAAMRVASAFGVRPVVSSYEDIPFLF